MSNVLSQLRYLADYTRAGDDEESDKYDVWTREQLEKAREFYNELDDEYDKSIDKQGDLREKIQKIKDKLDDKKLVFYDKEKNVPMNR